MKLEQFAKSKLPEWFVENHVKIVVKEALWLCNFYPKADKEIVEISAWFHDVGHIIFGGNYYKEEFVKSESHEIRGFKIAKEYLTDLKFPKEKIERIIHCIISHRTSKPPSPETIEAKIVASADNLAHFIKFDFLAGKLGVEKALKKINRDINIEFMLPEAKKKAERLLIEIKINMNKDSV